MEPRTEDKIPPVQIEMCKPGGHKGSHGAQNFLNVTLLASERTVCGHDIDSPEESDIGAGNARVSEFSRSSVSNHQLGKVIRRNKEGSVQE